MIETIPCHAYTRLSLVCDAQSAAISIGVAAAAAPLPMAPSPQTVQTAPIQNIDLNRVWTLNELEIMQDMARPIAVLVSGMYEDPHR